MCAPLDYFKPKKKGPFMILQRPFNNLYLCFRHRPCITAVHKQGFGEEWGLFPSRAHGVQKDSWKLQGSSAVLDGLICHEDVGQKS